MTDEQGGARGDGGGAVRLLAGGNPQIPEAVKWAAAPGWVQ